MISLLRPVAACACLLALTGQTLPPAPETADNDFCQRLAKTLGVEKVVTVNGQSKWTASALNFGQRFLFGGTAVTSVAAEPVEPATVEDYKRAKNTCLGEGGGAVCRLIGPLDFEFGWKGNKWVTPVAPGERAMVSVKGTKTSCQSGDFPPAG